MGFLTWNYDSYEVHASEGGHRDFSPRIERVISGNGIISIYQFLRDYHKQKISTPLANMLQDKEEVDSTIDMGSAIADAAIKKKRPSGNRINPNLS
jgi:glucokinase